MQIKVIRVESKTGKDSGRVYFVVTDEAGTQYSTFDENATRIPDGSVIEAEVEVKGKYKNIKSFKVVGESKAPSPPGKPAESSINYQVNNTADKIEASIEAQVAYKGIMEAFAASRLNEDHPAVMQALKWADSRLKPNVIVESVEAALRGY